MAQANDVTHPITISLDGSKYHSWAQNMVMFLESIKLWCYVTDAISQPIQKTNESDDAFDARLEDWNNIRAPSINNLLPGLEIAKVARDFLAMLPWNLVSRPKFLRSPRIKSIHF